VACGFAGVGERVCDAPGVVSRRRHEVRASGVHPLPDPPAHRGPQRGGDRRGRRAARLRRHHRPRGYKGYEHLTGALHAWCAAHNLRDLKALYDFEPARQAWAQDMAALLTGARDAAAAARQDGAAVLPEGVLAALLARYSELAAAGLTANLYRRSATAADARRLARRFRKYQDLILRFVTRPDLDIFTNNEPSGPSAPPKSKCAAQVAAGAPCKA